MMDTALCSICGVAHETADLEPCFECNVDNACYTCLRIHRKVCKQHIAFIQSVHTGGRTLTDVLANYKAGDDNTVRM